MGTKLTDAEIAGLLAFEGDMYLRSALLGHEREILSELLTLRVERDAARELAERLKLEAQGHAMEARTANSTIYEIYQVVSGATGEPGNWHGAEPVRERFAALEAQLARQGEALKAIEKMTDVAIGAGHVNIAQPANYTLSDHKDGLILAVNARARSTLSPEDSHG